VRPVADLIAAGAFGNAGPRLRARLADVCVLPSAGRMVWLCSASAAEHSYRGHHPDERETWVGALEL